MLSITEPGTLTHRSDLIGCCETDFPTRSQQQHPCYLLFYYPSLSPARYCAGWSIIEQSFIKSRSVFHRACLFEYTLRGERSLSLWTESPGSLFDLPHSATGDFTAKRTAHFLTHNPNIQHVTLSGQFHTHRPALHIHASLQTQPHNAHPSGPGSSYNILNLKEVAYTPFRTSSQKGLHLLLIFSTHTFSRPFFKISVSRLP